VKKCPYCGKEIPDDAIVCKLCKRYLPPPKPKPVDVVEKPKPVAVAEKKDIGVGAIFFAVLLSIFYVFVAILLFTTPYLSALDKSLVLIAIYTIFVIMATKSYHHKPGWGTYISLFFIGCTFVGILYVIFYAGKAIADYFSKKS